MYLQLSYWKIRVRISQILVTNTGEGYTNAPILKIVDSVNRNVINSGILKPILTGSAIASIDIDSPTKRFTRRFCRNIATNNTNGLRYKCRVIKFCIFTCAISTPTNTGIGTTSSFAVQPFQDWR